MTTAPVAPIDNQSWFYDEYSSNAGLWIKIKQEVVNVKTKYQQVRILDTFEFGKILVPNQFMYNAQNSTELTEMISHVPMNSGQSAKKKILLIGGGDGITLSQLVKYPEIEHIDLIDIDEELTQLCCHHFVVPESVWADSRVHYHFIDGYDFVAQSSDTYDLIIPVLSEIYSPDGSPGMAYRMYTPDFFQLAKEHLTPHGIFISEGTTVHYTSPGYQWFVFSQPLQQCFQIVKPYHFNSKRMPGGEFVLLYCSNQTDPIQNYAPRDNRLYTNYYNQAIHHTSFSLPEHMKQLWEKQPPA